jgi:regulator of replication initiation timing
MGKQEIFNAISKIDPSSIKEGSLKDVFTLMINLIEDLQQEILELKEENRSLRDKNNRLKGEHGRPDIKANTKPIDYSTKGKERKKKGHIKKAKKEHIEVHRTIKVDLDKKNLPRDAKFKYWEDTIAQDIVFKVSNTCYKLAVYHSRSLKKTFRAECPKGASYHSSDLQSFIITLNKVLDVTESKILTLLKSIGIKISKGSISNILLKYTEIAQREKQEILKAGLAGCYAQTDITGARVHGKNKYSNIITNDLFTSYTTTSGKSHLDVLAAFQGLDNKDGLNLIYDTQAVENLKKEKISIKDLRQLEIILKNKEIFSLGDFTDFIKQKIPELYRKKNIFIKVKSALAMAYYVYQDDIPKVHCLVSDNAPEYNKISLGIHALCWVHDARYYKKLDPSLELHRKKLTDFIGSYWKFYHTLFDYKKTPSAQSARKITARFDELLTTRTDYFQLDKLIKRTFKNRDGLLAVLQRPEIPLHNNLSELGARKKARKRDISYHTMSDTGTLCLDAFMTITQTAIQLNVDVYQYIGQMISGDQNRVTLAELIKLRC